VLSLDYRLRELYVIWNKGLSSKLDFPWCVGLWNKELSSEPEDHVIWNKELALSQISRSALDSGIRSPALS
jgi:hypothetical protein